MPLIIVFLRNNLICLPILSLCPLSEVVWLDSVVGAGSFLIKFSSFPQHSSRFLLASLVYVSLVRGFEFEGRQSGRVDFQERPPSSKPHSLTPPFPPTKL